jgi:NADH:ubiquinone oxidoreductase subunit K
MNPVWLVPAALGAIGLIGLIYKKSVLGLIVSLQLMSLGAAVLFVLSGVEAGAPLEGHSFSILIVFSGVLQTVGGYALAARMFYLRKKASVTELRELKR